MQWSKMSALGKANFVYNKQKEAAKGKKHYNGHINDLEIRKYIEDKLILGWSPEIIENKILGDIGKSISFKTIYRYVKKNRGLKQYLYESGKKRRQGVTVGRRRPKKSAETKKNIIERAESVQNRSAFGHWEGDLVLGKKKGSSTAILSLVERKTRFKEFIRIPDTKAETVLAYMRAFFVKQDETAVKSVSLDNGSEFTPSSMHKLESIFDGFKVYYTDAYAPEQKGSNEHANGRFRNKDFPKGTDFGMVSKFLVKLKTKKLNKRPMKVLEFKAPSQVYQNEIVNAQTGLLKAA